MNGPASSAGKFVGNRRQRGRRCNHVFGIAAVEIDTGDFAIHAHREIAAPALFADETMSAMPADANALTFLPGGDVVSDRVDLPGDFMTRHAWILQSGPETFFDKHVAVANAARFHFHANLCRHLAPECRVPPIQNLHRVC